MSEPSLRLEWMTPAELAENPANWRTHPTAQIDALTGAIAEVGWAGACLFNERTNRLVDGHARRKVAIDQRTDKIPVLIGNWTEDQEKKILATLDPLSAMAEANKEKLDALLKEVQTNSPAMQAMLDQLKNLPSDISADETEDEALPSGEEESPFVETWSVFVECGSEAEQLRALELIEGAGFKCRAMIA